MTVLIINPHACLDNGDTTSFTTVVVFDGFNKALPGHVKDRLAGMLLLGHRLAAQAADNMGLEEVKGILGEIPSVVARIQFEQFQVICGQIFPAAF